VTVGICIDAGSRNERPKPVSGGEATGITHIIEKMAWKNIAGKGREETQGQIDTMGAVVDCIVVKDFTLYAMTVAKANLEQGVTLLAEAVFQPDVGQATIADATEDAEFEVMNNIDPTDQEKVLNDATHQAAFGGSSYAHPKFATADALVPGFYSRNEIKSYLRSHYSPKRMTLICTGLDMDGAAFRDMADGIIEEKFQQSSFADGEVVDIVGDGCPEYTPGSHYLRREFNVMQSVSELPNNVHFSIAFPAPGFENVKQWLAVEVLRTMFGGGTTFSSGGPGKGMYARLYKDVLCHGFFWHCQSFHHAYAGTSLFGVSASCEPHFLSLGIELVLGEFVKLRWHGIEEVELERAKNQLKTNTFLNLECKPQQYEDLTKQLVYGGKWITPGEWEKIVDSIEIKDLKLVINEFLTHSTPSVAAVGDIDQMPKYEEIVDAININNTSTPGKLPQTYRQKLMTYLNGMRR